MKIKAYLKGVETELEVYKLQSAIFGEPSVLMYNEDRTQTHQEFKHNNVKALKEFMGKNVVKCYALGYTNENDQIVLIDKIDSKDVNF